ncbi:MAG TPA: DUF2807 domain-containing protein [Phenylobacterium sp.]
MLLRTEDERNMIRNLVLIAIAGFFTAAICFGAAFSFGGPDLAREHWGWRFDVDDDEDPDVAPAQELSGAQATRELAWTGESLDLDSAAEVRFTQAPGPGRMVITGPQQLLDTLKVENGRLSGGHEAEWRQVSVAITAPRITEFRLGGESTLVVEGYDQDRLMLSLSGRSDAAIRGRVRELTLNISEQSDADLGRLEAQEVLANVHDNGEVSVDPRARADLKVADSGKVTLVSRPPQLQVDVSGRGKVIDAHSGDTLEDAAPPQDQSADAAT